ncbi:gag-pol [Trichonephila clavipes]|nr:gag-pol [Trichonephila clavipes]
MIFPSVERHQSSYIDPSEGLPSVFFHPNLSAHVNKTSDLPEFLKKLALKVNSNIPEDALLIYTDGSRNKHSRSSSGIHIVPNYSSHIKLRKSNSCSVFRSELIAIDTGLKEALSIHASNSIWILADSRSANSTSLTGIRWIHLQWVPSHVSIVGNEIADSLAKDGAAQHAMNSAALTYSELHSTYINSKQTTVPPAHHWYEAKRPGGSLFLQCSRMEQTILTRFRSDHLRTLTFRNEKIPLLGTNQIRACGKHQEDWTVLQYHRNNLDDENACTAPFMAVKDFLAFVQSPQKFSDADSDDYNEMNNAAPVPTSSDMISIMKSMRRALNAHSKRHRTIC